ncbi:MAG TPA: cytochrome c biogenesis protein CcdA [Actinocrinis sp.]|nr:cytochrome c biogenesis protein CcdA [Actinocrinis sp.]
MSITSVINSGSLLLAVPVAVAAGAVSFASPCVLPLVPGYLSYVTGMSAADAQASVGAGAQELDEDGRPVVRRARGRGRTVLGALLFVLGFTAVFVSFGAAFGYFGATLRSRELEIERIFGVVTILLGLFFAEALPQRWSGWLQRDARVHYRPAIGLVGAPLLGVLFGVGWTPCVGPTLGAVESLAFTQASAGRGAFLSVAYCLGLGLPFILVALAFRRAMGAVGWLKGHYAVVTRLGGGMLVLVGLALVTGLWDEAIRQTQDWFSSSGVAL